jgi:hypothetical protein
MNTAAIGRSNRFHIKSFNQTLDKIPQFYYPLTHGIIAKNKFYLCDI